MGEGIFRKKSLDRVKSPENLDDYIRVSNPGIWLLLISVIVLLAGACVWGIFGHIDSIVTTVVRVEGGTAACYIAREDITEIRTGQTVRLADTEAVILRIGEEEAGGYSCILSADTSLPDGFYEGKIVIKSYRPLSFILN